jgi:hypothetical protein
MLAAVKRAPSCTEGAARLPHSKNYRPPHIFLVFGRAGSGIAETLFPKSSAVSSRVCWLAPCLLLHSI